MKGRVRNSGIDYLKDNLCVVYMFDAQLVF